MEQAVRQDALRLAHIEHLSVIQASVGAIGPKQSPGTLLDSEADALLAEVLLGRVSPALGRCTHLDVERLFERACFHGIASIIYERLKNAGTLVAPVAERFRREAMARAMWELRHRSLLIRLISVLREQDVDPVCFKGTALAYSLYEQPHHRSRGDTDLIVPQDALNSARAAFLTLGFRRQTSLPGDSVSAQETWVWRERGGGSHAIDLHWRINNASELGNLITYADLHTSAQSVPDLCGLLVPDTVTSLVIAAFHRAVHQFYPHPEPSGTLDTGERLCWLYDIHLLAQSLSPSEWTEAFDLAQSKGLAATFIESVRLAHERFRTSVPDRYLIATVTTGPADRYLQRPLLQRELSEVFGWGARRSLRYFVDVIFPPSEYVRSRYTKARWRWLPWLYVLRWSEGFAKRFALSRANQ